MPRPLRCLVIGEESLTIRCAEHLLARGHHVLAVVASGPIVAPWAASHDLPLLAPGADLADRARAQCPELQWLFSIANLRVLPPDVLALPSLGALNFHDGPLPKRAGLNAPAWAIHEQSLTHGVAWHRIVERVDAGDILASRTFELHPEDTARIANVRCAELAYESFVSLVEALERGDATGTPQDLAARTHRGRFERPAAAGLIDWSERADTLAAHVRATDEGTGRPSPLGTVKVLTPSGPWLVRGARVRRVGDGDGPSAVPGTVLAWTDDGPVVATGEGGELQLADVRDVHGRALDGARAAPAGMPVGLRLAAFDPDLALALSTWTDATIRHESFWSARLAETRPLTLGKTADGHATPVRIERADVILPGRLGAQGGLAAVMAWLGRSSEEPVFDVGFAARAAAGASDGVKAFFADTVPFRVDAGAEVKVSSFVEQVADERRRLDAHVTYPFDLAARTAGAEPFTPLVVVACAPDVTSVSAAAGARLTVALAEDGSCARLLGDVGALHAPLEVLAAQLQRVAMAMAAEDDLPVGRISLLSETERREALFAWNDTAQEEVPEACIHTLFEAQAERTPDGVALVQGDVRLRYRDLDARANQLAHHLIELGVGPDARVGLCLERTPDLVACALAVWKAGGAYVPLDPHYPPERIANQVRDSAPTVVLTTAALADRFTDTPCVRLDADNAAIVHRPTHAPRRQDVAPGHLAYVIYTSGSTGQPKGVMIEHRQLANFFTGMDAVVARDSGAWLSVTSLSFDIAVLELFYTLTRGIQVVLSRGITAHPEDPAGPAGRRSAPLGFSLFYFAADEGDAGADGYRLLLEGARFADQHGFEAVWTPERHFASFGGLYPNPAVAGAAIATITSNVKIRAGSCVLPLHSPVCITEDWALVDRLSGGRVGVSFAAGWHPDDFVLRPSSFENAKQVMLDDLRVVRALWRGETRELEGPRGPVKVRTLPRPVQPELPVWLTSAGSPETFAAAGREGTFVLTHLLGQSLAEAGAKIAVYRAAWKAAGHPGEGHVTLMLHTYIGATAEGVRETARGPMKRYLRSALGLIAEHAWTFPAFRRHAKEGVSLEDNFAGLSEEDAEALLEHAFDRYHDASGLFGTPTSARAMIERVRAVGVDEVACLVDFGIETETVLDGLVHLDALRAASTPRGASRDLSMAEEIEANGVTQLQCTPSLLRVMLQDDATRRALGRLTHIYLGGEPLPGPLVAELETVTSARITNMYGPTETTVWSATGPADATAAVVPLGRPIANTRLYVLDGAREPTPPGVAGELWIAGRGVARGYWQREELTAARFAIDPFHGGDPFGQAIERMYATGDRARRTADGTLEFLGRLDHQVKVRGHRIELGEIEAQLARHGQVREAAVVVLEDAPGDARIVAYVTGHASMPSTASLRAHLAAALPPFMLPSAFVALEAFPLTPNGKLDRRRLPPPEAVGERSRSSATRPVASALELKVAEVWNRLLGSSQVGLEDNFFSLGGHSLLAVQARREIEAATGISLSITDIFRFPTVVTLAAFLAEGGAEAKRTVGEDLGRAALRAAARRESVDARRRGRLG